MCKGIIFIALLVPSLSLAWEEQKVIQYVMAFNPVIRAHQDVTKSYTPPGPMRKILQHTSVFARFASGGESTSENGATTTTDPVTYGIQVTIPLSSPKEQREWAIQAMGLIQQIEEIRTRVLDDISLLRQNEADLAASEHKLKFVSEKVDWAEARVEQGYDDASILWEMAQQKINEGAAKNRMLILTDAQRQKVASHAGDHWEQLLAYLQGTGALLEDQ